MEREAVKCGECGTAPDDWPFVAVSHSHCAVCAEIDTARKQQGADAPGAKIRLSTPDGDTTDEIKARSVWAQQTKTGRDHARKVQQRMRRESKAK